MATDDAIQFGCAVVLVIALDLLTNIVAVQEAVYALITAPALALHAAFVRSATTASTAFSAVLPLVATISTVVGLYLLSRWRWERA